MSSVAARLTALVLAGVLALPPGLASADDPADLRGSIAALRQSLAQLREPPNLMLERDLSPLERLQRWVGVGQRKEHVGQYSDLWLHARNHQSFAALEAAIAENLLDTGAVESARKHLSYASANLRARHLYDEAASEVWRGNFEHAQAALLEAGKVVTSSLGLLGKVLESSKVKVVSEAGLVLKFEAMVLEVALDTAFKDVPTALANQYYAVGEQKVVEWAANAAKVDPQEAELARRGIRTAYHAGQFIAHLAAKVGPSAELQALIEEELRKLPADGQDSVDQALRELARLRGRPATEAVARPRPTPTPAPTTPAATAAPTPTPAPTTPTPDPSVLADVASDADADRLFVGMSREAVDALLRAQAPDAMKFPFPFDPHGARFQLWTAPTRVESGQPTFQMFYIRVVAGSVVVKSIVIGIQATRRETFFTADGPRYLVVPTDQDFWKETGFSFRYATRGAFLEVTNAAVTLTPWSDVGAPPTKFVGGVGHALLRLDASMPPLGIWPGQPHILIHGKGLGGYADGSTLSATSILRSGDGRIVYVR